MTLKMANLTEDEKRRIFEAIAKGTAAAGSPIEVIKKSSSIISGPHQETTPEDFSLADLLGEEGELKVKPVEKKKSIRRPRANTAITPGSNSDDPTFFLNEADDIDRAFKKAAEDKIKKKEADKPDTDSPELGSW